MLKHYKKILILALITMGVVLAGAADAVIPCQYHNVYGWAWSENVGWMSFSCGNCDSDFDGTTDIGKYAQCPAGNSSEDYGVNFDSATGLFSGYAWSENIGWIRFDPPATDGYPVGGPNYSACLDLPGPGQICDGVGDYTVSGWARACAVFPEGSCSGALRPDSERGGWDGWIKLRGTWANGVSLNTSPTPKEFEGWAWGGDDNNQEAVIGWVSFNRTNCDPDKNGQSNGIGNCPPAGTAISDYKVMMDISINPAPSATNLNVTEGDYCFRNEPPIYLNWTFLDPGDSQSAYQIQIDSSGSGFPSPEVDTGKVSSVSNTYAPLGLSFGTQYWWRLKVWDSGDTSSAWITAPSSFFTDSHKWPNPSFSGNPVQPRVGQIVNFTDTTVFDDGTCASNPDDPTCFYSWTFQDATPATSSNRNPSVTFNSSGAKQVTLQATDSDGYSCTITGAVSVNLPLPSWKEIPPF